MSKVRYAVSKDSNDSFPVLFRPECERTYFDHETGKDESLVEVIERLSSAGYELKDRVNSTAFENAKRECDDILAKFRTEGI